MTPFLRPAARTDLAAVVDLYCRYEQQHRGAPDTDEGDLLQDWDSEGFDLAASTRVLEQDGRVLGYAVTDGTGWADTVTEVERWGEGLQAALLDWLEGRGEHLHHYVPAADHDLAGLLERRGWHPARRYWRMRRELTAPAPRPAWPTGVVVRDYQRPGDDESVHALVESAFAEIGDQPARTLTQWRAFLIGVERFDSELCLVATDGQRVVGAALSQNSGDYGFVRQLAVAPSHRGQGLALALLHECFARHAARGLPATVLGVDAANPTGALGLYEKAGMRVTEQFARWDCP